MRIFFFSLSILLIFSCKAKEDGHSESTEMKQSNLTPQTQALILTQPFEYDASRKGKINDVYVAKTKLTLPDNFNSKSKWLMFEGPVLENDLVAYRYYADSRHRFDIYGKTVNDLVMDTVSWKYHDIMNWGSDILKVGNSLGLGSPAIYYKDSIYTLSDCSKKEIEIITTGAKTSSIRTTFTGLNIEDHQFDLIQDWSIEAGNPSSKIKLNVVNGKLPEGMRFATGIVKKLPKIITKTSHSTFYAMNWGKQTFHGENMGMAIVSKDKYRPTMIENKLNHLMVFGLDNSEVIYSFVSIWEKDLNKVTSEEGFINLVTNIKHSNI